MRLPWLLIMALSVAAAAPDMEDLPPVDELVDQLLSGLITPEELVHMGAHMSPGYIRDIKHQLPDDMRAQIAAIIHARSTPEPPTVDDQPAEDADDEYDYGYDYTEDEETAADIVHPEPEPEAQPVPHGEPAQYKEEQTEPPMRDGGGVLRGDAPLREGAPLEEEAPLREDSPLREDAPFREDFREEAVEGDLRGDEQGGGGGTADGGVVPMPVPGEPITDARAVGLLRTYAQLESMVCQGLSTNLYTFYTVDQTTGPNKVDAEVEYQKVWRQLAENVSRLDLSGLDRTDILERFMVLKHAGVSALDDAQLRAMDTARNTLETRLARTTVCDFFDDKANKEQKNCGLKLFQDIRVKFASSTNLEELQYYWVAWRDLLSRKIHSAYTTYVQKLNDAAHKHNPDSDAWDLLTYPYKRGNSGDLLARLEQIWQQQVAPLYEELHTYARYRLRQRYGAEQVPPDGPIPAHLFGSVEADDWTPLEPIMRPVNNASGLDFYRNCVEKSVDVGKLKNMAKSLYTGLGLNDSSVQDFLQSRLNVAAGENVLFLPRVIDRCFRPGAGRHQVAVAIYPTNLTLSDYIELIELFGEMQVYKERARPQGDGLDFVYKNRDSFRDSGLDRAIGGARALSALTPTGLQRLLGFSRLDGQEELLNLQMALSLKLLPRLAHSMAVLHWQYDVFTGRVTERDYNSAWWQYKEKYQGVMPPQKRDESDFDAFADGTITLTNHHLRRLIGGVAMFSVHKFMCRMYGKQTNPATPLSECALLNNAEVGHKISELLVAGGGRSFQDQLAAVTGEQELTGKAMVEQLQPVSEWMVDFNKRTDPKKENSQTVAIVVGVIIGVIILGLIVFFVVARRKQRYQDYKGAPTQEMRAAPQQA